jgi:hypothetical protein
VSHFTVNVGGLEIFICNVDELMRKPFVQVLRRQLLQPLSIQLIMKQFLVIWPKNLKFSNKKTIDVLIEQTSVKVSSSDIALMKNTANHLLA